MPSHRHMFVLPLLLLSALCLGAPVKEGRSAATTLTNLEYGRAGGESLLLDVSVPDGPGPYPVAILVHGGGWTGGDKAGADIAPWFETLTDAQFTWFSINYRLAPQHQWPAPLDDVLAAIRWVKANAARYRGDTARIALVGYSAGGHLASYAATVPDDRARVQAVVGYAPLTDFVQELPMRGNVLGRAQQGLLNRPPDLTPESLGLLRALSPINQVRPGLSPFLLLHGDQDQSVPFAQSVAFQAKLQAEGVRCDLLVVPGAPHRLTEWHAFMPDHGARVMAWLRGVLGAPAAKARPATGVALQARAGADGSTRAVSRTIIEAEDGVFTGKVDGHSCWRNVMLSDALHSTHSGKGAVDTRNEVGSFVEVTFDAHAAGPHRISVRYTHVKPDPRPGALRVNGVVVHPSLAMPQTAALPAWETVSTVVDLSRGTNVIRLSALNDGGLPNVDYIKVRELRETSPSEVPRVEVLEAEDGVFAGTVDDHSCWQFIAAVEAPHSGPTGTGFVDTVNEPGSYVEVAVDAARAGAHALIVRYVHNKPDDRSAEVRVNGAVQNPSLAFPQTGAWTAWKTVSTPVQLGAGRNLIRLVALNPGGLANVDHVEIRSEPAAREIGAGAQIRWDVAVVRQKPEWYASAEARAVADSVLQYQSPQDAWPKSTDLAVAPRSPDDIPPPGGGRANSLDNDATTLPMQFLALVAHATGEPRYREAFARGVDYLLAAQYPNGGWPQFSPLRDGYYSRITYNDDAMVRALIVLRDAAAGRPPYGFVDAARRARAGAAVARGIDCILRTQVRQQGKLTAWGAQHDERTLAPAWARTYEPPSLSGSESVGIVRFLMEIERPTPEIAAAVQGAVDWFGAVAIHGLRLEELTDAQGRRDRRVVPDPSAPLLWARFYELNTNRPIFLGRDSVVHYAFSEIELERRIGYNYYGTWPATLLARDYPRWREKHKQMVAQPPPSAAPRYRVLVSTDIGGTDFDDFQSMVHLLLYADSLDIEGLVSSPYGPGRKAHILSVIERYERDYQNLMRSSDTYPTSDALRAITKQGAIDVAGPAGFGKPTEGSEWIVTAARRDDPRPLYVLVWGGIEDLAQALHDAPDILPKLRVYFIGGPNKKWSVDAYHYIATHHQQLWMIEANATYRGWFTGGNQTGEWGNDSFVAAHIAGHGALGEFFARGISFDSITRSTLKMGDTPSVGWLLHGTPEDPSQPGWGGQFVRAWERPYRVFARLTTASDEIEQFGVFELALPIGDGAPGQPEARMEIENQSLAGFVDAKGAMRFRFSPKDAKVYEYTIRANTLALEGRTGALTSVRPPPDAALRPSPLLPNWWTDDPAPAVAEGSALGARTVSRWRDAFLRDFAARLVRCKPPASR